jgi:hypothetical protein
MVMEELTVNIPQLPTLYDGHKGCGNELDDFANIYDDSLMSSASKNNEGEFEDIFMDVPHHHKPHEEAREYSSINGCGVDGTLNSLLISPHYTLEHISNAQPTAVSGHVVEPNEVVVVVVVDNNNNPASPILGTENNDSSNISNAGFQQAKRSERSKNSSKFKGVSFNKKSNKCKCCMHHSLCTQLDFVFFSPILITQLQKY